MHVVECNEINGNQYDYWFKYKPFFTWLVNKNVTTYKDIQKKYLGLLLLHSDPFPIYILYYNQGKSVFITFYPHLGT